MALISTILGFSAFGFGARCFQLGLQHRPIFDAFHGHAYAVIAFGLLGAGAYGAEQKQTAMLQAKKKILLEHREKEKIEWEASKGQAQAHAI
ncbi:hypothetical protein IAR55_004598 [Kwoniella newhampshirensis]|uniref:ATP synthase subunit e, mitochondrial n=1 Tax=Kwoniella newhampshirensis TaxID=1651941 RepID=A0AAW0YNV0_9TREE